MMTLRREILMGGLLAAACAALAACAGVQNIVTQVSSYGTWTPAHKPVSYAFDRLPSQDAQAAEQDRVESAAMPALEGAGFVAAPRDKADVLIQVGAQLTEYNDRWADPFYWRGDWWYYRRHAFFSPGFGAYYSSPLYQREVGVLVRDSKTNAALYETHARYTNSWSSDNLLPAMFEAAMKDFPQPAISPRQVVVAMPR